MSELEEMADNINHQIDMEAKLRVYAQDNPKDYAGLLRLEFNLSKGTNNTYEPGSILMRYNFFGDDALMEYYIAAVQAGIGKLFMK